MPVANEEEADENIMDMSNNIDYTTGNLLDFAYFKENYKLIAIDLSKQTKLKDPQQVNFIGKFENQTNGATMFSSLKNQKKLLLNFHKILPHLLNGSDNENSKFATKNGMLLTVNQKVFIHTKIQSNF